MSFNDFINLGEIWWWMIVLLNFFGYFLLRYGMTGDARLKAIIELMGSGLIVASFIAMVMLFGFLSLISLIVIFWIIITPTVEIAVRKMNL